MAYGLIDYNTLKDIGNALRSKANTNVNYYPRDMARAIDSIVTSDGIDEPCMFSTDIYYNGPSDNSIIHRGQAVGFEVCNNFQTIINSESYNIIDEHAEWPVASPDTVIFYERVGTINQRTGYIYGLYIDEKWPEDKGSVIDISNLFPYTYGITEAYCGKYTTKMVNTYYSCYGIREAVCKDYVTDMSFAYMYCGNIVNAACGNNVKTMNNAYYSCYNLTKAVIGPNVKYASAAYYGCYNINGEVNLGNNLEKIDTMFCDCNNITNFHGDLNNVVTANSAFSNCCNASFDRSDLTKLQYGYSMFNNCQNLKDIGNIGNLFNAGYMFYNCVNLVNIGNINFENIYSAPAMFYRVPGVTQELHDNFINTASNNDFKLIFAYCNGINKAYISNRWSSTYNLNAMYQGCEITDIDFAVDATSMSYILYSSNTNIARCSDTIINMVYAFSNCNKITDAAMGANVNNAYRAYSDCLNLLNAACSDNIQTLYETYYNCTNLTTAAIGANVTNIYQAYYNCVNLYGDLDLLNVNRLYRAFYNASNIQNILITSNNIEMNRYHLENAFYRTNYSLRRNIVLTNQNSYNNFIAYSMNTLGRMVLTQDTFAEAVSVNVNNVDYNALRYAYNENYNVYVYCTE